MVVRFKTSPRLNYLHKRRTFGMEEDDPVDPPLPTGEKVISDESSERKLLRERIVAFQGFFASLLLVSMIPFFLEGILRITDVLAQINSLPSNSSSTNSSSFPETLSNLTSASLNLLMNVSNNDSSTTVSNSNMNSLLTPSQLRGLWLVSTCTSWVASLGFYACCLALQTLSKAFLWRGVIGVILLTLTSFGFDTYLQLFFSNSVNSIIPNSSILLSSTVHIIFVAVFSLLICLFFWIFSSLTSFIGSEEELDSDHREEFLEVLDFKIPMDSLLVKLQGVNSSNIPILAVVMDLTLDKLKNLKKKGMNRELEANMAGILITDESRFFHFKNCKGFMVLNKKNYQPIPIPKDSKLYSGVDEGSRFPIINFPYKYTISIDCFSHFIQFPHRIITVYRYEKDDKIEHYMGLGVIDEETGRELYMSFDGKIHKDQNREVIIPHYLCLDDNVHVSRASSLYFIDDKNPYNYLIFQNGQKILSNGDKVG